MISGFLLPALSGVGSSGGTAVQVSYPDTYVAGVNTASHSYPYLKVPNPANLRTRGPFVPFLTGCTQFDLPATSVNGGVISSGGTLVAGGLIVQKTNFVSLFNSLPPGAMFHVTSGANATPGDYAIQSIDNTGQITLATSAGAGGGASNLVGYIHCPNNDSNLVVCAYNLGTSVGTLLQAGEPGFGIVIETDYLRPDATLGGAFRRDMEWYLTFRKKDGSGAEIRPLSYSYAPDSHELTEAGTLTTGPTFGSTFTISYPGEPYAYYLFSNGSFNMRTTKNVNVTLDVYAPAGKECYLTLHPDNDAGYFRMHAINSQVASLEFSAIEAMRFYKTNGLNGSCVAINNTSNGAGLTVQAPPGGYGYGLVVRPYNGMTGDLIRVEPNGGGTPVFSMDVNGFQTVSVGSLAANATPANAPLVKPFTSISAAGAARGVILPVPTVAGLVLEGFNASSSFPINLQPNSGGKINGGTTDVALAIPALKAFRAVALSTTSWAVILSI